MKQAPIVAPVLIEYLDTYRRELSQFLQNGFAEYVQSNGRVKHRDLTYQERLRLLGEIVRVEQEIRVLSYFADSLNRFNQRLVDDAYNAHEVNKGLRPEW